MSNYFRNWDNPYYQRNNNNYGWGDALAQIGAAIIQRNADRKAAQDEVSLLTDAPNALNNGLDLGNQTHYQDTGGAGNPNSDFTNKVQIQQAQGLLSGNPMGQVAPSINVPTSANIGQGLLSGTQQPQPQQQSFFTMPTADQPQAQQQQTNPNDVMGAQYSKANNPISTTVSAPMTPEQAKVAMNSQVATAAKELYSKGYKPAQFMPLLQQRANEILTQHSTDYTKQLNDNAISGVMNAQSPVDQKKALINYYQVSGKMDPATLRGLLMNNTKPVDDGANINFYRTDAMGNPVDVDQEGKPVPYYTVEKQISPSTQATIDNARYMHDTPSGSAILAANTRASGGGGRSGSGGGSDDVLSKEEKAMLGKAQTIQNSFRSKYFDTLTNQWRDGYQQDPMYQAYKDAVSTENSLMRKYAGSFSSDAQGAGLAGGVDYNEAMTKVGSLLNGKYSRAQIENAIRADYGDMADNIIADTDWSVLDKKEPNNITDNDYLGLGG